MKKLIFILLLFLPVVIQAQKKINSEVVYINFDNVKHIVFPARVTDLTIGSECYIQSSVIEAAPNIISLSAVEENFSSSTNLTVICGNGKAYSYHVLYRDSTLDSNVIFAEGTFLPQEYNILINKENTSLLFFPDDVIYLKPGNEESLFVETRNNVVKVKTPLDKILPSNLFVVDSRNNVYNISVGTGFSDSYLYNFSSDEKEGEFPAKVEVNEVEMDSLLKKTMQIPRRIFSMGSIKNKFEFSLTNILVKAELLFFVFEMRNSSNIDFDIDFIKCFLVDKKTTKNTIQQEEVVESIRQRNFQHKIRAKKENRFTLVFKKFIIPDDKFFKVEIYEKGGGRHVNFNIENSIIINADVF